MFSLDLQIDYFESIRYTLDPFWPMNGKIANIDECFQ